MPPLTKFSSSFSKVTDPLRPLFIHHLKEGATKWGFTLLGLVIERAATAIALILLARQLIPETFGQYIAIYSLATIMVVIPIFGMDTWLLSRGKSRFEEVIQLWNITLKILIVLFLIWFIFMAGLSIVLPHNTYPITVYFIVLVGVAFDGIILLSYSALRSLHKHVTVAIIQSLVAISLLCFVTLFTGKLGIIQFALIRALISALAAIIIIRLLGIDTLFLKPKNVSIKKTVKELTPFILADAAGVVYLKADINIIALILGSLASGIYGPALNLLQVCFLLPQAIYFWILPKLSYIYRITDLRFRDVSKLQFALHILTGAGLSIGLYFLAPSLVQLTFGERYLQSAEILKILSPIAFLKAANYGLATILISSQNQLHRTRLQLFIALFNIIGNLIIIKNYGIIGVAVIYIFSEAILLMGYLVLTVRILGKHPTTSVDIPEMLGKP